MKGKYLVDLLSCFIGANLKQAHNLFVVSFDLDFLFLFPFFLNFFWFC